VSLLQLVQASEASSVGTAIRDSVWLFPAIEFVHLIAFAAIGGAVLIVDLRLLGLILKRHAVREIATDAHPWFVRSLIVMFVSGVLLFTSESVKCYYSIPFRVKMLALFLAIIYTSVMRRRAMAAMTEEPAWGRFFAVISILLWGTVAWGGRWIGFSG
jgi:hypothetical protein